MPVTAVVTVDASASANGLASSWIPLDIHSTPFNVGFGIDVSGKAGARATVRVEHTFDNILNGDTPTVYVHEDVSSVPTSGSSRDGNYAFGVRACRLVVVSASGSTRPNFRVVQVGGNTA